jgi:hypothetical protein
MIKVEDKKNESRHLNVKRNTGKDKLRILSKAGVRNSFSHLDGDTGVRKGSQMLIHRTKWSS